MAELTQLGANCGRLQPRCRVRAQTGSRHAEGGAEDPRGICARRRVRRACGWASWAAAAPGLSYQFKFAPEPRPRDHVFEFEDVRVFVDPKSMVFLDGMTLDWQDSLMQSGLCVPESARNQELRLRHFLFRLVRSWLVIGSSAMPLHRPLTHVLPRPRISTNFLAFERKLTLDDDALQKRFYELSRQWHPDRFSRKSAEEQAEALEATAILNDGYRRCAIR